MFNFGGPGVFSRCYIHRKINDLRGQLNEEVDRIAETQGIEGLPNGQNVRDMVSRYSWRQKYDKLKELAWKVYHEGHSVVEQDVIDIMYLFSEENEAKRKKVLQSYGEIPCKNELLAYLRENNIYVLSRGSVEDYYPEGVSGEDKPAKALCACSLLSTREAVCRVCPKLSDGEDKKFEFDIIFSKIFD